MDGEEEMDMKYIVKQGEVKRRNGDENQDQVLQKCSGKLRSSIINYRLVRGMELVNGDSCAAQP